VLAVATKSRRIGRNPSEGYQRVPTDVRSTGSIHRRPSCVRVDRLVGFDPLDPAIHDLPTGSVVLHHHRVARASHSGLGQPEGHEAATGDRHDCRHTEAEGFIVRGGHSGDHRAGRPGGPAGYVDASDFIRHVAGPLKAGTAHELSATFEVIERLVVEGDPYVQNLGEMGYLEGFQMRTLTTFGLDPEVEVRPRLGAVSERWWDRINRFWAGDADALREL
jgi:hypothetical protein